MRAACARSKNKEESLHGRPTRPLGQFKSVWSNELCCGASDSSEVQFHDYVNRDKLTRMTHLTRRVPEVTRQKHKVSALQNESIDFRTSWHRLNAFVTWKVRIVGLVLNEEPVKFGIQCDVSDWV